MSLPMEKAKYPAVATAISFGKSQKGNLEIAVGFELVDHDLAGESITWIGHFTDKTQDRTIESLQHAGWQGEDLSELDGLDEAAVRAALPNVVELACGPEEYQGEWQLKVQWVNRPGSGRFAFKEPLSGNELRAFGAQLRANVRAVRGAGGTSRKPSQAGQRAPGSSRGSEPHPNAPGSRDDIPF